MEKEENRLYPEGAILLAPLSGYTDYPFRAAARRGGCRYAFTEMIDAAALVYARERTRKMLFRGEDEEFLGVQLLGRNEKHLKVAAQILDDYDFDVLDFNLGCPVPKVAAKGAGAVLGRDVEAALACFEVIAENSRFPLSAKIRIANESDVEMTLRLARGLAERGARAITVHGRVKEKVYSGPVFYDQIRVLREELDVQVIANGGIFDRESYGNAVRESGCETVMAARGAMGNLWLFDGFRRPDREELLGSMRRHVLETVEFYGEEAGMKISRKNIHDYLKGRGFCGEWRGRASYLSTVRELDEFIAAAPEMRRAGDAGNGSV